MDDIRTDIWMTVPRDTMLEMQRRMLRIRLFEERAAKMVRRGQIPGTLHTSVGQEAQVVGACMALRPQDNIAGTHRSHGHPIGKGAKLGPLMAELVGKATGVCRGKGGSLHLADASIGSLGESGITGSSIPIAAGAALSAQVLGEDRVALSFFGDGAANQGVLYESLNLASAWRLPVIFLCENNQYALSTPAHTVTGGRIWKRAEGFGLPGVLVEDGQDVLAVYEAVSAAAERARRGEGSTLIEVMTYRFREHAEGLRLAVDYRDPAEREHWMSRDPIKLFRAALIERRIADEATLDALEAVAAQEVEDAVKFSDDSPYPAPEVAFEDLFTDAYDLESVQ